jgi:hypothetical protein
MMEKSYQSKTEYGFTIYPPDILPIRIPTPPETFETSDPDVQAELEHHLGVEEIKPSSSPSSKSDND